MRTALLIVSALACGTATAGDPAAGRSKSTTCAACHGPQGISANPIWPNLAGQKEEYMRKQLRDFRDRRRSDPTMSPLAAPLSDADINDLAAFYASLR